MATLTDFLPVDDPVRIREDARRRLQRLATEAGMKQVARDLEEEIILAEKGQSFNEVPYRAGQPVWWFPTVDNRPAFLMTKYQRMIAANVKSVNHERRTVLIVHQDVTRTEHTFLVPAIELYRREIPGR